MTALPAQLTTPPIFRPLTVHDAALINAIGAAIVPPVPDPFVVQDVLEIARQVLPLVSRDHVLMRDLAAAAAQLVATWPARRQRADEGAFNLWARAQHDAAVALGAIMHVRAAQAFGAATEGLKA